jgi:hypothetical protein
MKYLILVSLLLVGCSDDIPVNNNKAVVLSKSSSSQLVSGELGILEVCYQGTVYLYTFAGGITPKIIDPLKMTGKGC